MITYKIRLVKNQVTQSNSYFPVMASLSYVDFEQIASEIAAKSTTTRADVAAVLTALEELIPKKLSNTQSVRLGRLGSFRPTIRSNGGCTNKDEVTAKLISNVRCRFSPGIYVRREMEISKLTFKLKK